MTTTRLRSARAALPALGVAAAAVVTGEHVPLLGPLLLALVVGAVMANTPLSGHRALTDHRAITTTLLRCGVVLLGLRISGTDLLAVGTSGLVVIVLTVLCTYTATEAIGRRLRLDRDLVTLVAAGFSICGAAAVAAVTDAVRAKERHVAIAVALVTLYGSAMIAVVPGMAGLLGLTERQAAVWAGASIHEVAQVAAAASITGAGAVAVAMTVKLGRVLLLAPVHAAAARQNAGTGAGGGVPWFVTGFAVAVLIRSSGLLPGTAVAGAEPVTTLLLAAGMFGMGLNIRARDLWPIRPAALLLAAASTTVAAGTSLALTLALVR